MTTMSLRGLMEGTAFDRPIEELSALIAGVPGDGGGGGGGGGRWGPGALEERERELVALRRELRRSRKETHEAQQMLLALSRRKVSAAAGTHGEECERLRDALLQQEVGRVAAEARNAQLEQQVALYEEAALRRRHAERRASPPRSPPGRVLVPFLGSGA